MDKIEIYSTVDFKVGKSVWFPFDCKNIRPDGACTYHLAYDLPAFVNKDDALNCLANLPGTRPVQWIEFQNNEIHKYPDLVQFLRKDSAALR